MTSEAKAVSTSSTPLNEQDVQFLSDGYDDLVKSGKGVSEELKKKTRKETECIWVLCQQHHQGNRLFAYSYQYNIKITSDRETS